MDNETANNVERDTANMATSWKRDGEVPSWRHDVARPQRAPARRRIFCSAPKAVVRAAM